MPLSTVLAVQSPLISPLSLRSPQLAGSPTRLRLRLVPQPSPLYNWDEEDPSRVLLQKSAYCVLDSNTRDPVLGGRAVPGFGAHICSSNSLQQLAHSLQGLLQHRIFYPQAAREATALAAALLGAESFSEVSTAHRSAERHPARPAKSTMWTLCTTLGRVAALYEVCAPHCAFQSPDSHPSPCRSGAPKKSPARSTRLSSLFSSLLDCFSPTMSGYRSQSPDASLQKWDSEMTNEVTQAAPRRTFTMKSSVADSHARTVAALHAPDTPKEVNNFGTYLIGVSEWHSLGFLGR